MPSPLLKQMGSEAIGTFCLVFAGTGAIVANDVSDGSVTQVGIALTFGLVVLAMIYAVGDISGAHLNPAVTLAFVAARRLPHRSAITFIASQCLGAILASLLLRILFPMNLTLGATIPHGAPHQAFLLEVTLTFVLMFVILGVSTGAKEKGITAGIAIGAVIALEALMGGPISGASMNPARSLGPAIVTLNFVGVWIYVAAPILGALAAIPACRCVREPGCCKFKTAETEQ